MLELILALVIWYQGLQWDVLDDNLRQALPQNCTEAVGGYAYEDGGMKCRIGDGYIVFPAYDDVKPGQ